MHSFIPTKSKLYINLHIIEWDNKKSEKKKVSREHKYTYILNNVILIKDENIGCVLKHVRKTNIYQAKIKYM